MMLKFPPNCHRSVRNDMRLFLRTKQYPNTTPYYKVLKSATRTILYYKVLFQYYSVLQSTTKYYSSTT